ncbi:HD domain-containing protein [Geminisphaera colitermitum]|uniref:HD domain-containing protein n=1 Tax=Geminisphaera colitermitum TaxID=1148786 RepID=UPI000158D568|nr:HD domain-containing protein [Geminisphaera colitermitum]
MPEDPLPLHARLARQFAFIIEADKLKEILRQSLLTQSRRRENDAEHSWHICLMAMTLAEHSNTPVDVLRVIKMLLIHDIVEIDAGDTYAYDTAAAATQHERETRAADRLFHLLPQDQAADFRALWEEFESRATPESRFAAALDRVQPILLNCLSEGRKWREHGVTRDHIIARCAHAAEGSAAIWDHARQLIDTTVANGWLAASPNQSTP